MPVDQHRSEDRAATGPDDSPRPVPARRDACCHCGAPCPASAFAHAGNSFCCQGCRTVFELLTENGLADFYRLSDTAGVRVTRPAAPGQFAYLDAPETRARLVDFSDARLTHVTFRLPAIHCIACVWLLENLFQLQPGIGSSQVNFPRQEAAIAFDPARVKLSEIAALLTSLGYEPDLKLADLDTAAAARRPVSRRLWLQLAVAGFAFGNIMLFSISSYFGLDGFSGPGLQKLFGYLSLVLALPVFFFSAADYWRAAWISLRQRVLTIDVPIAAGIAALFAQSVYEVVSGRGEGYFDSLAGLLFFLLGGKLFQQKTYERLAFDRDYKSFFPLSVTRLARPSSAARVHAGSVEEQVSLAQLAPGDHLALRHGELIPADARLFSGHAVIDYSFVTGESEPVEKNPGDPLFAGGRQIGGRIEIELTKNVSQSYLTSLWNQDAFRKDKSGTLDNLTNRYSQRFTKIILAIALGAALFWAFADPAKAVKAFTSVLIVACPCALALAAPFALGTAQRVLGRRNVFLKNPGVLEALARVDTLVFDKTGTLTAAGAGSVAWHGTPLSEAEERWLYSMTRHSTHPLPVRIGEAIARQHFPEPVRSFLETPGCGMEASVAGQEIWMGSAAWLASRNVPIPNADIVAAAPGAPSIARHDGGSVPTGRAMLGAPIHEEKGRSATPLKSEIAPSGSSVHVALNGRYRGCYHLASALRPATETLIGRLAPHYSLALLSGDHAREQARFLELFGPAAALHFQQTPLHKLAFIRDLQASRKTVAMIGDGLNDAGALQQSDVGIAVVEHINAFSPASDVILAAGMIPRLADILRFAKNSVRTVRAAFLISTLYNIVGISIAASGRLSPIVCAILMPLSSITVVAFACGMTTWLGRRLAQPEAKP